MCGAVLTRDTRALEFTCIALSQNVEKPSEELSGLVP